MIMQANFFNNGLDPVLNGAKSLTRVILSAAEPAMTGMQEIGKGIGSIFLLFVIFVYISNILDGGKFQVKMLLPLLIYVAVCNFKFVASPVVTFATTLQKQCVEACDKVQGKFMSNITNGKYDSGEAWSLWHAFLEQSKSNPQTEFEQKLATSSRNTEDESNVVEEDDDSPKRFSFKGLGMNFFNALNWFKESIVGQFLSSFIHDPGKAIVYGAMGCIVTLLDWIAQLLNIALTALGAVMMAIVVAFGPITWAFAIFPGNSKTIGAWAIRICQFALYSPIVALIQAFFTTCMYMFTNGLFQSVSEGGSSILAAAGLILGLIAALMSVPAIASMIIEGAQGAVTISQGLMTASSLTQLGEPLRDRSMQNTMSGAVGGGAGQSSGGAGAGAGTGGPTNGGAPTGLSGGGH